MQEQTNKSTDSLDITQPCYLYKINNWGDMSVWSIHREGCTVIIQWGTMENTSKGPTIPKTMQSTSETFDTVEKAEFEVQSRINKQCDRKGYFDKIPTARAIKPMLAQNFDAERIKEWPQIILQPKLDGFRCIGSQVQLLSRKDTRIASCPHIEHALIPLPRGMKLDGELYVHNLDFQTIQSYVKRDTPHQYHKFIEYHVYDIVDTSMDYETRLRVLEELFDILNETWINSFRSDCPIKYVPTHRINNDLHVMDSIKTFYNHYKESKYEGVMLKNPNGMYEIDKRSYDLLKYKEFLTHEFEIVGVEEGTGSGKGKAIFVCKTENGSTFNVSPAFTDAVKKRIWNNRKNYPGRWLVVKFQEWYSVPTRVPRQPIGLSVIKDKDQNK